MNPWFRMYFSLANDPKVQTLSDRAFKAWVNLLCVACECGGTIIKSEIPFRLRITQHQTNSILSELSGLFDEVSETEIEPHNWEGRQFQSDTSTARVKRFRERKRNVTVTPSEQNRTDTEQNRTDTAPKNPAQSVQSGCLDDFQEFLSAATKVGLPAGEDDWRQAKAAWKPLDFEQKLQAIAGLQERNDEYQDPAFRPLPQNYLAKRLWTRPVRPKPKPNGAPGSFESAVDRAAARYEENKRRVSGAGA